MIKCRRVLSGELKTLARAPADKKGMRAATYQLTSEPRRLPPPNGGAISKRNGDVPAHPRSEPRRRQLKGLSEGNFGEDRRDRLAQEAGQMSEAWSRKERG